MRILMVTPSYYPIIGGSETLTQTLTVRLNKMGISTDIMTFNMNEKWHPIWRDEIEDKGLYKIFRISAMNPFSIFTLNPSDSLYRINVIPKSSFKRKLEEYDVIHFLGEADLTFSSYSYFVQKPKIMHCVATYPLLEYYRRHSFLRRPFRQLFVRLADRYIVSSKDETRLLSELGVPLSKLVILPIGVDVNTFHPNEGKKMDNLLLFVGRIYRSKGLHILLRALYYLELPTNLVIIGPRWDEKYVEKIEQISCRINEEGVHTVKIMPPVDRTDLVPWYQMATIVVCPYLVESYSNITREALACGTPVVSTGKHIVESGGDGILLSPKNPKKLASAIARLLQDKQMRKKYGNQGREIVEKHLSWNSIVKDLEGIYANMLTI